MILSYSGLKCLLSIDSLRLVKERIKRQRDAGVIWGVDERAEQVQFLSGASRMQALNFVSHRLSIKYYKAGKTPFLSVGCA
jgi:hypothetical protein